MSNVFKTQISEWKKRTASAPVLLEAVEEWKSLFTHHKGVSEVFTVELDDEAEITATNSTEEKDEKSLEIGAAYEVVKGALKASKTCTVTDKVVVRELHKQVEKTVMSFPETTETMWLWQLHHTYVFSNGQILKIKSSITEKTDTCAPPTPLKRDFF